MDKYEDLESELDPHRAEERSAAAAEVTARLRARDHGGSPEALSVFEPALGRR